VDYQALVHPKFLVARCLAKKSRQHAVDTTTYSVLKKFISNQEDFLLKKVQIVIEFFERL